MKKEKAFTVVGLCKGQGLDFYVTVPAKMSSIPEVPEVISVGRTLYVIETSAPLTYRATTVPKAVKVKQFIPSVTRRRRNSSVGRALDL